MLITAPLLLQPKVHSESCNEAGSQIPAERVSGFWTGIFQFWEWRVVPLSYAHGFHNMYLVSLDDVML